MLLKFIARAHRHTYAAPKDIKLKYKVKFPSFSNHTEYVFIDGDFKYVDFYAGWYWPPGKEIVFYDDKPVWTMSYQGKVSAGLSDEFIEEVYAFLKKALMNFDDAMPFRGPKEFVEGDFKYVFVMNRDYDYFTGREAIFYKGEEVFFQDIMGTLVK